MELNEMNTVCINNKILNELAFLEWLKDVNASYKMTSHSFNL